MTRYEVMKEQPPEGARFVHIHRAYSDCSDYPGACFEYQDAPGLLKTKVVRIPPDLIGKAVRCVVPTIHLSGPLRQYGLGPRPDESGQECWDRWNSWHWVLEDE